MTEMVAVVTKAIMLEVQGHDLARDNGDGSFTVTAAQIELLDIVCQSAAKAALEAVAGVVEAMPDRTITMWDHPGSPPGNGIHGTRPKDIANALRAALTP